MLEFVEIVKEFELPFLNTPKKSTGYALHFSDGELPEESVVNVKNELNKHDFSLNDEEIEIKVGYNVMDSEADIWMYIYCKNHKLEHLSGSGLNKYFDKQKTRFMEFYNWKNFY